MLQIVKVENLRICIDMTVLCDNYYIKFVLQ